MENYFCKNENKHYFCTPKPNGAIAQLVEQRTENPCVPGSIPGGTTYKRQTQLNINQLRFLFDEFAPHLHHIKSFILLLHRSFVLSFFTLQSWSKEICFHSHHKKILQNLTSRAFESPFMYCLIVDLEKHNVYQINNLLFNFEPKRGLPFVHYPFDVNCGYSKHQVI